MARDGLGRRLLSALADSTPAFTPAPAGTDQSRVRRLLSALADSAPAVHRDDSPDSYTSSPVPPGDSAEATDRLRMSGDFPADNAARHRGLEAHLQVGNAEGIGEVIRFDVVSHGDAARVLHVVGEIDTLAAEVLRSHLDEQVAAVRLLIVDLSGVTFLGSAGLAKLVAAKLDADRRQHTLRLVLGPRIVTRAVEVAGLLGFFDIADGVPQALEPTGGQPSRRSGPGAHPDGS